MKLPIAATYRFSFLLIYMFAMYATSWASISLRACGLRMNISAAARPKPSKPPLAALDSAYFLGPVVPSCWKQATSIISFVPRGGEPAPDFSWAVFLVIVILSVNSKILGSNFLVDACGRSWSGYGRPNGGGSSCGAAGATVPGSVKPLRC